MGKHISIILGLLGVISLLCSFFVHPFFLQFLVLGIFFLCLCLISVCVFSFNKNKVEIEELKTILKEHNELIKEDIEELKKR